VLDRVSVQEAIWLIVRPFDELKMKERADLEQLCQISPKFSTLYTLVQSFGQMVRKQQGHLLSDWKQRVAESGLPEIQRFVKGLERDKEAVFAGLTEIYSNGMTEGFVNKLKLIKRQGWISTPASADAVCALSISIISLRERKKQACTVSPMLCMNL